MSPLTKDQRREFSAAAHHLKPILSIGKEGISKAFIDSVYEAFNTRELLKVRALEACPLDREAISEKLDALKDIALVRNIGKTFILYKPLPKEDEEKGFRKASKLKSKR